MESAEEEGDEQKKGVAVEANRQAEVKKMQQGLREQELEERLAGSMSYRRRRR